MVIRLCVYASLTSKGVISPRYHRSNYGSAYWSPSASQNPKSHLVPFTNCMHLRKANIQCIVAFPFKYFRFLVSWASLRQMKTSKRMR